ncbi:hypothetical protein [Acetivibrio straminisolvens]|jgi:hypothetical protein|uniref:hypothetical protein n=1 Tax=Acetivibrio straminisolvens TaxID=253314 RepID=UPI0005705D8D|nr:hypothetical protein [Acetivibrio straminisolvens]
MSKEFVKILAYLELVLGTIGSFFLAYSGGRVVKVTYLPNISYQRDWGTTIAIFLAAIFSTLILYTLLRSQYEIIDNQENLYYTMNKKLTYLSDDLSDEDKWRCPKCNKKNPTYVGTCGCGYAKQ